MFGKPKSNPSEDDQVEGAAPETGADVADTSRSGSGAGFLLDRSKPSVISEGFSLQGDITAQGVLHVEGYIKGTVQTDVVNIGPRGAVEGQITCKTLHIKGAFVGTANCDELVIANKARVVGRVTYRTLAVQRGAMVEGDLVHAG
jgi:cytoskeletal protein CcmA (bactofilin family)